jgi:hypothetical protein
LKQWQQNMQNYLTQKYDWSNLLKIRNIIHIEDQVVSLS